MKATPGIHDIPNETYHRMSGISSTDLKTIHAQTPAHWKHAKENPPEPKDSWNLGTAVHAMVLEPDTVHQTIAVAPKVNRRTNAGKAEWAAFQEHNLGKTILTESQWSQAQSMTERVLDHPRAMEALSGGKAEQSVFSEYHGHILKARPDYWASSLLSDLKTTRDASPHGFQRQAADLGYHIQAVHYLQVCAEHGPAEAFLFIAVESSPPYEVACYLADEQMLSIGRDHAYEAMQLLMTCRRTNEYPGYSPEVELLSLPGWMVANHAYQKQRYE